MVRKMTERIHLKKYFSFNASSGRLVGTTIIKTTKLKARTLGRENKEGQLIKLVTKKIQIERRKMSFNTSPHHRISFSGL